MGNSEIFNSVINSLRKFKDFFLDTCKITTLENFWRLKAVANKYGDKIAEFKWESNKLAQAETTVLLNYFPNIKTLTAASWKLHTEFYEQRTEEVYLPSLKKLKIVNCDKATIDFFENHLPKHQIADLVLQANFSDLDGELKSIDSFLASQQSVQKLDLTVDCFDPYSLSGMKLSHFSLKLRKYRSAGQSNIIQAIVENQPKLISLNLISCEGCFDGDDDSFIAVCNLKKLDDLSINIDELNSETFMENFGKIKNLKSLEIESVEHNYAAIITILEDLSHFDLTNLKKLKLTLVNVSVPIDRIERMGKNFKILRSLTIQCDRPLALDSYLGNFKELESLQIDYHYSKEFSSLCTNFDFKYTKLRYLSLNGFAFGSDNFNGNEFTLLQLTEIVPNLEKLEIDAIFPFQTEFIFKIMEKWKNLKILKNWSMVQNGSNYHTFDQQSVLDLKGIAKMLDQFSIELRIKVIEIDISQVKKDLSEDFCVTLSKVGNFIVIRMNKK